MGFVCVVSVLLSCCTLCICEHGFFFLFFHLQEETHGKRNSVQYPFCEIRENDIWVYMALFLILQSLLWAQQQCEKTHASLCDSGSGVQCNTLSDEIGASRRESSCSQADGLQRQVDEETCILQGSHGQIRWLGLGSDEIAVFRHEEAAIVGQHAKVDLMNHVGKCAVIIRSDVVQDFVDDAGRVGDAHGAHGMRTHEYGHCSVLYMLCALFHK